MLQDDPALEGVGMVIFDEFHERALQADLGLALSREVQEALRDDLRILIMSATLDVVPVARLLGDAPILKSEGRSYPVSTRYLPPGRTPWLEHVQRTLLDLINTEPGSILVFLPGAGEIRRLEQYLPADLQLAPLYGDLPAQAQAQDSAIALEFIKPGTPTQNSYVERFNRTCRDEILNMYVFRNLTEVRELTANWMTEYNDERPHDSLNDLTPWEYLARHTQLENSNQRCN